MAFVGLAAKGARKAVPGASLPLPPTMEASWSLNVNGQLARASRYQPRREAEDSLQVHGRPWGESNRIGPSPPSPSAVSPCPWGYERGGCERQAYGRPIPANAALPSSQLQLWKMEVLLPCGHTETNLDSWHRLTSHISVTSYEHRARRRALSVKPRTCSWGIKG